MAEMPKPKIEIEKKEFVIKEGEYVCQYGEQWKSDLFTQAYNGFLPEHRDDMVMTWIHESGFNPEAVSGKNSNGTRDYGLCQLNSRYHWEFINSEEFKDPIKQIDYCLSVYRDAVKKKRPLSKVWYGWASRLKHKNKYTCNKI